LYTFINVSGLALGVACCVIIFLMIRFETSFDNFHKKADRIYRINLNYKTPQGVQLSGYNFSPLTDAVRHELTGIERATGVYCLQLYQFTKDNNIFEDKYAFFADEEYANVFDVRWFAGNPAQALSKPGSVVVTDRFAEKFLNGVSRAVGSTFTLENRLTLTVTGVVSEPPANTDHPYSMLISYSSLPQFNPEAIDNWDRVFAGATYILINESTSIEKLYPQLDGIIIQHMKGDAAANTKFFLMPLNDNHDRNYDYDNFTYDFPVPVMIILSIMAGMIAFIACVNFTNLSTAQSLRRAREVGIRKTMGSTKAQLILQHMTEAFVITGISVLTGLGLAKIGINELNKLYGGEYVKFNLLNEPSTIIFIAGITLLISIFAGFYPAFILARFKPVLALRSQTFSGKTRGFSLRKSLVVLQFAGAQILILVTLILINQIRHFKERPIGFDPETIVLLPHLRGNDQMQYSRLEKELEKVPGIISHTFAFGLPEGGEPVEFADREQAQRKKTGFVNYVDQSFLSVFGLKVAAGQNFADDQSQKSTEVMVNESLTKELGFNNPQEAMGSIFFLGDEQVKVRAVIKDFYTQVLSSAVDPVILRYDSSRFDGIAMNISTSNISDVITGIETAWRNVYPEYLCKYEFMDEVVKRRYGFFNTIFTFMGIASVIAIFIGCLGMYGLISFMAVQRTKEIGIRKVFGATVKNILMMFTRESGLLILVGFVFATPVAHFFGNAMLSEMPERIPQGFEIYALTLAASLFIALITVSYRSFSAAIQNPVESLKTE
jgi:putative ABC transport system permease protein